jgi:hypothetical protein
MLKSKPDPKSMKPGAKAKSSPGQSRAHVAKAGRADKPMLHKDREHQAKKTGNAK